MRRALVRYTSPSAVRLTRRVVRCSSGTPRRASSWASRLLTAGVLTASSRAAADRLPQRASRLKKAISEEAAGAADIVEPRGINGPDSRPFVTAP